MREIDAEDLKSRVSSGNESVAGELFEAYRPRLRRLVSLRMHPRLQSRVDASDVLQEVYLEVARRFPDYASDQEIPFFLWLRMLTGKHLIALQRKHLGAEKRTALREIPLVTDHMPNASVANLASHLAGSFTSVDRRLIHDELFAKLLKTLEDVQPEDREIIAMRHFEELSTSEIATVLGLTRSGVLKRYTRAIRRLRVAAFGDQDIQFQ